MDNGNKEPLNEIDTQSQNETDKALKSPENGETEVSAKENRPEAAETESGAEDVETVNATIEKDVEEKASSTESPDFTDAAENAYTHRPQNAPAQPNAAELLNSYLFSVDTGENIEPPEKDSDRLKEIWKRIGVLLLTMAVAFSGAFACLYWVCEAALFGDSDFFSAIISKSSGVEINKVEVDMISGNYEEDTIALAEKVRQYSVDITVYDSNNERLGSGSGVIISEDGMALTNYHVVYGNETGIKAVLHDGTACSATVLHLDKLSDLAIIKLETNKKLTPVTFADSTKAKAGQRIVACGNPLGLASTVSFGYIAHPDRDLGESVGNYIQVDAAVNPGNSGGGVYDAMGNLIGIINSKASGTNVDGIGYAIPSARIISVMNDLLKQNYVGGRPAIGFTVVQVNQSTWDYFKNGDGVNPGQLNEFLYEAKYGIYIIESKYNENIITGDRLISCDGVEFTDREDFGNWITRYKIDDTVSITVERIVSVSQNEDGSYKVVRERLTFDCVIHERDWVDEPSTR